MAEKKQCSKCGSPELCEFCKFYKLDSRISLPKDAVFIPNKGFCVNGIPLTDWKQK